MCVKIAYLLRIGDTIIPTPQWRSLNGGQMVLIFVVGGGLTFSYEQQVAAEDLAFVWHNDDITTNRAKIDVAHETCIFYIFWSSSGTTLPIGNIQRSNASMFVEGGGCDVVGYVRTHDGFILDHVWWPMVSYRYLTFAFHFECQ